MPCRAVPTVYGSLRRKLLLRQSTGWKKSRKLASANWSCSCFWLIAPTTLIHHCQGLLIPPNLIFSFPACSVFFPHLALLDLNSFNRFHHQPLLQVLVSFLGKACQSKVIQPGMATLWTFRVLLSQALWQTLGLPGLEILSYVF